ncbi:MAG TPA: hypothetical protein VIH17_06945 [Candidatus Acidoferrales bacterium]
MSPPSAGLIETLLFVWGGITVLLIGLIIYRGLVGMREEDQLFLDAAEEHMQREQEEIVARVTRVAPFITVLSYLSGGMILLILALWLWRQVSEF